MKREKIEEEEKKRKMKNKEMIYGVNSKFEFGQWNYVVYGPFESEKQADEWLYYEGYSSGVRQLMGKMSAIERAGKEAVEKCYKFPPLKNEYKCSKCLCRECVNPVCKNALCDGAVDTGFDFQCFVEAYGDNSACFMSRLDKEKVEKGASFDSFEEFCDSIKTFVDYTEKIYRVRKENEK